MKNFFLSGCIIVMLMALNGCHEKKIKFSKPIASPEALLALNKSFEKRIEKVADGIYVAIGYGLANSILIEGNDSLIIVDCMESMEVGKEVKEAFDKISLKPLKAIIYTHNHPDHVFGAMAMAGNYAPDVYAHELLPYHLDQTAAVVRPILEKRAYRMFGIFLQNEALVNCGIGPHLNMDEHTQLGVIRPNIVFSDSLSVTIAGINIRLFHAPGETPDQLMVWLPEQKILLCGDNLYKTFPNLYTIRGTPYRDINLWKNSIDKMRYLHPAIIIPSHTEPIHGADDIQKILTDYRDAIQYVHDQTVRGMNLGMMPDELAEKIILPEHLQQSPYLQEFYGKTEWSVRSVFDGYMGFFDGNPTNLLPMKQKERAEKMQQLAGGKEALLNQIEKADSEKNYQWVLELTDYYLELYRGNQQATAFRINALTKLGEQQANPNARHYYLTSALELDGLHLKQLATPSAAMVHHIPLAAIFNGMATRLNAEKSIDISKLAVFEFTDTGEKWSVQVRRGVAEVQPFVIGNADITIKTKSVVWKELAAKLRKPAATYLSGEIKVDGGQLAFLSFLRLFDIEE
jgi:alkyl sulfatase BDS1-like metallo-beta-lactamase superfamily hydrolase